MICKALVPAEWEAPGGDALPGITSVMSTLEGIDPASIRVAPSIYQPLLDKVCEFKVLFLGQHYFALRMDTDRDNGYERPYTFLDPSVEFSAASLPEELVCKFRALMKNMNLVFAVFDVILTVDMEYVFLELNQGGQFLFIEEECPDVPVLDAMCHFLVHRSLDVWKPTTASLSLHDLQRSPGVREMDAARRRREAESGLRKMRQSI
jgi:hypothetical protein